MVNMWVYILPQQILHVLEEVYRWVLFTFYLFNDKCFWTQRTADMFFFFVALLSQCSMSVSFPLLFDHYIAFCWITLLALPMKEVCNKSIKSKKRAWKCCKNYCTWRLLFGDFLGPIFNNLLYFSSRPNF